MKASVKHLLPALAAGILLIGLIAVPPATAYAEGASQQVLYVTGKGGVKVKPDIAYISLEVSTKEGDANAAQSKNNAIITAIIAELKSLGIAEEDVNTSNYQLSQSRLYRDGTYYPDGYTASCSLKVTVRDLDTVGKAIDHAIAAGASRISGIQFGIADTTPYYAQALDAAGKDARSKANALAKALGVKITAVLVVEEISTNYAPVSYSNTSTDALSPEAAPMATVTMPVQADELSVTASIKVTFAIE